MFLQVTIFWVHCGGCFYYLLAAHYHNPSITQIEVSIDHFCEASLWVQYMTSIYWSIATMTSVGYSDLAMITREMFFNIFYMLSNLGFLAYLVGNMTDLFNHGTRQTVQYVSDHFLLYIIFRMKYR